MKKLKTSGQVLVFVAHADDETIGCGGYIPILTERGYSVTVAVASCGRFARGDQEIDNRPHAIEACRILGVEDIHFLDLEDQRFEQYGTREIVGRLDGLGLEPGLILTHCGRDLNRDHRVIHEIALIYARPLTRRIRVLGCEIINSAEFAGDAFRPNYYVDIEQTLEAKKQAFGCYGNEARPFPHPYSIEGLEVKARQRGLEVGLPFAEAYQVIRWFDGPS
ncbi:PIG-L deacetylase family protein [Thermodesulfobacteriota bacterium]